MMRLNNTLRKLSFVGLLSLGVPGLPAFAQDFILPYNKTPETAAEYWAAVKYEMNLGNHTRSGLMLRGFYEKLTALSDDDQKKFMLGIYDRDTITPLLKLGALPQVRQQTIKDADNKEKVIVDLLQSKLTTYLETRLSDPERIKFFVNNLTKSREERAYAITQLRASGARSIPAFLSILKDKGQANLHPALLSGLLKMDNDIGPPLLAALNSSDNSLRSIIVTTFGQRADNRIVPYLHHLRSAPSVGTDVKKQAAELLTRFTGKTTFGDPRVDLLNEAEKYYHGRTSGTESTTLWKWNDETGLTSAAGNRSQWEESQALDFAKKALEIDPSHIPSQVELLSIALDKTYERFGPAAELGKVNPQLQGMLAATNPQVLDEVLAKAIADKKTNVVMGAARALATSGNNSSLKGSERGFSPLMAALNYPDQRSRFAAADAALSISGSETFEGSSRVVRVLSQSLGVAGKPKAVVGLADTEKAQNLVTTLQALGFETSVARSGTQLLRLAQSNGADLLITDTELPDPGFPHFLSTYKANSEYSSTPLLIAAGNKARQTSDSVANLARVKVVETLPVTADLMKQELQSLNQETKSVPLADAERQAMAKTGVSHLLSIAKAERSNIDLRAAEPALVASLQNDLIAGPAALALSHRSGANLQSALAQAVINPNRVPEVRLELAKALQHSLLKNGNHLTAEQIKGLAALSDVEDASLKMQGDRLNALLKNDASQLGNRLKALEPVKSGEKPKVEPGS